LARFDSDGTTCIFNRSATHIVADVQGYLADSAVDDIVDQRLLDTRTGPPPENGSIVTISGGRPDTTGIVSLVVTEAAGPGFLSIIPCGSTATPTSNLNYDSVGQTTAGLTFVRFDSHGDACVYVLTQAHVVADVQGYLDASGFDDVADTRLADTRSGASPGDGSITVLTGRPGATGLVSLVATAAGGPGFLQVLPCGTSPGSTSNVNYDSAGATVNALAAVEFGTDGTACVFALTATHVVADLQGYFTDGAFDDIPDLRVLDTRVG
jgi:hypothetical protein